MRFEVQVKNSDGTIQKMAKCELTSDAALLFHHYQAKGTPVCVIDTYQGGDDRYHAVTFDFFD